MDIFFDKVMKLKKETNKIFIYGAGLYGRNLYEILKKKNIGIDGFLVSVKTNENELFGLPVYEASKIIQRESYGIIVGVNRHNAEEIKKILDNAGVEKDKIIWGNEFLDKDGVRGGYDEMPMMEFTTIIGCSVNCKFCPQNLFVKKYFEVNPNRPSNMSLETFEKCLNNLPHDCHLSFGGMSEAFLNDDCGEMLKLACATGRKVDLYTTLVGASIQDVKLISKLPINFICLHVADEKKYANIPLTEEYYKKVSFLTNQKRGDGTPLVHMCNAQTNPDKRVEKICEKYDILITMNDRAGNLEDEKLYRHQCSSGKISCSMCGDKLNRNILLPDGTVLLCCMDFGMKHVLGNLLNNTYDEIMNGAEINMIKKGLDGDISKDILCRTCSCANVRIS